MAEAGSATKVDSLDEQISALLASVAVEPRRVHEPDPQPTQLRQSPAPRAQTVAPVPARYRGPRHFRLDLATRELAYFVIAGLIIGALIGVLIALSDSGALLG